MLAAQWVLVGVTGALVFVTVLYMWHTKKMADEMHEQAKVMKREFEIRVRPFLSIAIEPMVVTGVLDPEIEIHFENAGYYTVLIESISALYIREDNTGSLLARDVINQPLKSCEQASREMILRFSKLEFTRETGKPIPSKVRFKVNFNDSEGGSHLYTEDVVFRS